MVDTLPYISGDHAAMAAILLVEGTHNGLSVVRSALEEASYHVLHTTEWRMAWVGALLRRTELVKQRQQMKPAKAPPLLTYQALCLDHRTHQVALDGAVLALSPTEFALLHLLMRSPGRVFHRAYLLDTLWGEAYAGGDRTVDNIVLRLRKKLGSQGEAIETVWGIGYRLRDSGQKEKNTGE